jgi:hypothetical protein
MMGDQQGDTDGLAAERALMDALFSPLGRTDPHAVLRSSEVPGCRYEFPDRTQRRRLRLVLFGFDDRGEFGFVAFLVPGEHAERVAPRCFVDGDADRDQDDLADLAGHGRRPSRLCEPMTWLASSTICSTCATEPGGGFDNLR